MVAWVDTIVSVLNCEHTNLKCGKTIKQINVSKAVHSGAGSINSINNTTITRNIIRNIMPCFQKVHFLLFLFFHFFFVFVGIIVILTFAIKGPTFYFILT